jgi:hypothetical protein
LPVNLFNIGNHELARSIWLKNIGREYYKE